MAYAQELKMVKPYLRPGRPKNRGLPREQEDFASHPCAIDAAASRLFSDFINARSAVRRPAYFDVWLTSLSCFTSLSISRQVCNST
jgi:hypothetical protein